MELIDDEGLRGAASLLAKSGWKTGTPLVLVSPAPVIGNSTVELWQEQFSAGSTSNLYKNDVEYWKANLAGWRRLVRWLSDLAPRPLVVLSGDVHYGFQSDVTFTAGRGIPNTFRLIQLVASALKNQASWKGRLGLNSVPALPSDEEYLHQTVPYREIDPPPVGRGSFAALDEFEWDLARQLLGQSPTDVISWIVAVGNLRPRAPDWVERRSYPGALVTANNFGLVAKNSKGDLLHSLFEQSLSGDRAWRHCRFRF
jgi:hypothetical protein